MKVTEVTVTLPLFSGDVELLVMVIVPATLLWPTTTPVGNAGKTLAMTDAEAWGRATDNGAATITEATSSRMRERSPPPADHRPCRRRRRLTIAAPRTSPLASEGGCVAPVAWHIVAPLGGLCENFLPPPLERRRARRHRQPAQWPRRRPPPRPGPCRGGAGDRREWRETGGTSSRPRFCRLSRRASPAAGPSTSATATALFSSTTGVGATASSCVVERHDLPPVGVGGNHGVAVHCVDGGLDLIRSRLVAPQARPDDGLAFDDERPVPSGTILIGEQQRVRPRESGRAGRRDSMSSISASRPATSASSGISATRMRPRRMASAHRSSRTSWSPALVVYPSLKIR